MCSGGELGKQAGQLPGTGPPALGGSGNLRLPRTPPPRTVAAGQRQTTSALPHLLLKTLAKLL